MSDTQSRADSIISKFRKVYGEKPKVIVRSPGRVNLIGEHTDYNDGYVLPIAIDRDVMVAASPASESQVSLYSVDFDRRTNFCLDRIERDAANSWGNYTRGVALTLQQRRHRLGGAKMAIQGNVPLGAGLSSSAALEVASALAFQLLNGFKMSGPEMALVGQAAENNFVGVNCGIMDQFISRLGMKNHALFIDCRTLDYETVPLPSHGVKIIVANTNKKHALVDSEYNLRRQQCEEAVSVLRNYLPTVRALRDVTVADLRSYRSEMPDVCARRVEHVVSENDRVLESVEALKRGQVALFGLLMNQSHDSLRDLYEVSCPELDAMVEAARPIPGVYGSRMTGGGFGGCTVSLVEDEAVEEFLRVVPTEYQSRTGIEPTLYVCTAESGAQVLLNKVG